MAAADREPVARNQLAKELDAFDPAHVRDHRRHPFVIIAFDREFPFPLGRQQIPIRFGEVLFPDLVGVVGLHEHVVQRRDPFAVRGHGGRDQVFVMRRADFLQQILAPQRFLLRRNDGDHIGAGAAGARFGDDLPQNDFRAGAPDVDPDAVLAPERFDQLIEPFRSKYGIRVDVWRARSEIVLRKVIAEARAGGPSADVNAIISPQEEALRRENLLQEIRSPHHKDLVPAAVPAHREWVSTLHHVFVQAYNTDKVRKEDLPKTYRDLLAPKWKGKLAIEGDDHEWMSSVIADMGEVEGVKFFRDLVASNGLSVRSGHPLLTNLVASGEVPLALTVYQYSVEQAKKKGSPIDWFVIEPAVSITNAIGVAKRAPHPHAALLFYDYIISAEGQRMLAKIGYVPTHLRIEWPVKGVKLKFLDAANLLDEQEKSFGLFEQIILKGAAASASPMAAQYGRLAPLTVVRHINRRCVEGKSVRAWEEQRLSQRRSSPTRQTCS